MPVEACLNTVACVPSDGSQDGRDPQKVRKAAEQFEALLIGQMLKTVRESSGTDGWMGAGAGSSDSVMGYAEQNLASVLSSQGGLGLAQLVASGLVSSIKAAGGTGGEGAAGAATQKVSGK